MAKGTKPTSDECAVAAETIKQLVAYLRKVYPNFAITPKNIYRLDVSGDTLLTFADYFAANPKED